MLVFCEECGIKYSFPPEKVDPDTEEYKKMNQQPAKKEADSSSGKRKI
jgi:hypothetical protein